MALKHARKDKKPLIFPHVDNLIEGDPPRGLFILLLAPPGSGKTVFCQQFLYHGLSQGYPAVYVHTDEPIDSIEAGMRSFGWDISQYIDKNMIRFVDCYSWRVSSKRTSKYYVDSPSNLSEVSLTIEDARQGLKNARLVFDCLSNLMIDTGSQSIIKFFEILSARVKRSGMTGLCVLQSGVHDERTVQTLRYMADGIFELRLSESESGIKRAFRIFSLKGVKHSTSWIPFEITDNGIVMEI
ncbi:MAG: RAD55 family ATPase [Candidatus Hydrothermarchaeota archaeon]